MSPASRSRSTWSGRWWSVPGGREIPFAVDPVVRERLLNGWDDIALTLAHEEEISLYEATRERVGPVTTPFLT